MINIIKIEIESPVKWQKISYRYESDELVPLTCKIVKTGLFSKSAICAGFSDDNIKIFDL